MPSPGKRPSELALRGAAFALLAAGAAFAMAGPPRASAEARAPRAPLRVAGIWDAAWRNDSGEPKRGLIVVEQSGARLGARIESHGNVTATGSIAGQLFTLRGSRMGVPFTITGRVQGRRMTGTLTSLLLERRFTATRRRGR